MPDVWFNLRIGSHHLQIGRNGRFKVDWNYNPFHEGKPWWDIELMTFLNPFTFKVQYSVVMNKKKES